MAKSLVSNPPYNLKWEAPIFAQLQNRFSKFSLPPNSNANFAFVLTALDLIDEKAALLLPCAVLSSNVATEEEIRKQLIENNVIEAVIALPDKMFESTSIPTVILLLNKNKKTMKIEFIDMRQEYAEEQRYQNGQYGGSSHENRTYSKTFKVLTDEGINKALKAIEEHEKIPGFCKVVSIEEIRECEYTLVPSRYIEFKSEHIMHRPYEDIAADYNRIINEKNALKLTINETIAKSLGLYDIFQSTKYQPDISESFAIVGQKAEKENFIQLSKNAAEFKIENKSKDKFPEMLMQFLQTWKCHIMFLNNEENRLLAEFRDALIPDLIEGKIKTTQNSGESNNACKSEKHMI